MQDLVCASELIALGYQVSSPSVVELAGDLASEPASDFGAGLVEICTKLIEHITDLLQNGTKLCENEGHNYYAHGCHTNRVGVATVVGVLGSPF